jgi:hypothetical protein
MAKHSKKKFIGNIKVDWKIGDIEGAEENAQRSKEIDFDLWNKAFMQLADNTIIQGFVYKTNKGRVIIPEPEPSILYFTNAEHKLQEIIRRKDMIMSSSGFNNVHDMSNIFYGLFQLSSDYIVNLFNSLEAFNNSLFNDDFEMKHKRKIYNKERAQRSLDFASKMKKAIPIATSKFYVKDNGHEYEFILKIKELRDDTVHLKNLSTGFPASYRELYVKYLEFDFQRSYQVIKDYMNYYKEDWIIDCDCGE